MELLLSCANAVSTKAKNHKQLNLHLSISPNSDLKSVQYKVMKQTRAHHIRYDIVYLKLGIVILKLHIY